MNKAQEACNALKGAREAFRQILSSEFGMQSGSDYYQINVASTRDLEQIPGEIEFVKRGRDKWPWKARKMFEGVEFYKLLTASEYEAAKQAS